MPHSLLYSSLTSLSSYRTHNLTRFSKEMPYVWCFARRYCAISALNTAVGSFTRSVRNTSRHLKQKWHPPCFPFVFVPFKFPPLPAKAQVNVSTKALKQLGECITSNRNIIFKDEDPLPDVLLCFFSPSQRLCCRCPWLRGVAAVLSSPGNLPQARRLARHSQQKQRGGDLSHQHRSKETTSFFYAAVFITSPCDQDEEEHKTTTEKSDAILMTVESY